MSNIQAWVMQLCVVCILVTVILSFIKNDKMNNSIKTVLALYILLTAMALPLGKDISPGEITDFSYEGVAPVNAQAIVKENAQKALVAQINTALDSALIEAQCIEIILNEDLTQVQLVVLSAADNAKKAAEGCVKAALGSSEDMIIKYKG